MERNCQNDVCISYSVGDDHCIIFTTKCIFFRCLVWFVTVPVSLLSMGPDPISRTETETYANSVFIQANGFPFPGMLTIEKDTKFNNVIILS